MPLLTCTESVRHLNNSLIGRTKSKEKRREEYKQRLAQCASNLKTLDSIEEAITRKKEEVELKQKTCELVQIDVCKSASTHTSCLDAFKPVEYEILSVDINAVSEFEQGEIVSCCNNESAQASMELDPTFMELDLLDLFIENSVATDETFTVDPCDHMYAQCAEQTEVTEEKCSAKELSTSTVQMHNHLYAQCQNIAVNVNL